LELEWDGQIVYQSKREKLYKKAIDKLLVNDRAYRCFCSKEKIAEDRKAAESKGGAYLYPGTCRNLENSEVENRIKSGEEYSVRIKIPEGHTSFDDMIYGKIVVNNKEIDDFVIARNDGTPVYNLVVVCR